MNSLGQITKQEAKYVSRSSSPAEHRCGICTEVHKCPSTGIHYCKLVEGAVDDMGGCELFDKDLIKWATDPITLADYPPKS